MTKDKGMGILRQMEATAQAELFPVIHAQVPKRSLLRQVMDAWDNPDIGPIVTQAMAAAAMDVSKQRVHQLVQKGILASVKIEGHTWVPVAAVEQWLSVEHPTGRPITLGGMWKSAMRERKSEQAQRKAKK